MGEGALIELRMLGPLEVVVGERLVPVGGPKQRAVLARIGLHPGIPVSQDTLMDTLWRESLPETAATTVSAYVSRLKKLLGARVLDRGPTGYFLDPGTVTRDVDRFEALLGEAAADPTARVDALKAATDLWRGPFLGDLGSEPWAQPEATRLGELRSLAMEERFIVALDDGAGPELVPELELELSRSPFRERLWEALMLALYRSGRQVDALRAFKRAALILGEDLGIEPGERLRHLEESILFQHPELLTRVELAQAVGVPNNLPGRVQPILGRDAESDSLTRRLSEERLVTLVGIGGVGKTTLALEVAHRSAASYPGGVWWVDLARLTVGSRVGDAFMDAMGLELRPGLGPIDIAASAVGDLAALFVVDSCEHLLGDAREAIRRLLATAPRSAIIATSREVLLLDGEAVAPIGPLTVPGSVDEGADNPSVRLFARRAAAAAGDFQLSSAALPLVVEIVQRLDGLPLAIEIAASQIPMMTLRDLASSLQERFASLKLQGKTPRHTTMQAALDWSWQRLDKAPRRTLAYLSAFAGPFTKEAAMLTAGEDAGEHLGVLTHLSLLEGPLEAGLDGQVRYRMLEPLKQFVKGRIPDGLDPDLAHAATFARLAEREENRLHGPAQADAFARFEGDVDEYVKAVGAVAGREDGTPLVAAIASALWYWLMQKGDATSARELLEGATASSGLNSGVRARLLAANALVGTELGDPRASEQAKELIRSAVNLPPAERAWVLLFAGDALTSLGEYLASRDPLETAASVFAEPALSWAKGWAHLRLCRSYGLAGDFAAGDAHLAAAEKHLSLAGDLQHIAYARLVRGNRDRLLGNFESSLVSIRDALNRFVVLGQELVADKCRALEIQVLMSLGRWDEAIHLSGRLEQSARVEGRPTSVPGARFLTAQALVGKGVEIVEARRVCRALARDAEELGAGHLVPLVAAELAWLHLLDGEVEKAASLGPGLEALRRSENPWSAEVGHIFDARIALRQGDRETAINAANRAVEILPIERHPHGAITGNVVAGLAGDDPVGRLRAVEDALEDFELGLDAITTRDLLELRRLVTNRSGAV